jgi:hypothetical protein
MKFRLGQKVKRIDGPFKGQRLTIVCISCHEYRVRSDDPIVGDLTYRDEDLLPFQNGVELFMESL